MKPKVVVIVGPTASGKTAISIELAKKINGEIISSDSMQIYKDVLRHFRLNCCFVVNSPKGEMYG